jgi:hypothetical protein
MLINLKYSYNILKQSRRLNNTFVSSVNSDIVDVYKNKDLKMDCLRPKHVVIDKKVKYCD